MYQNRALVSVCSEVGQVAYLIAVLSWIWTITHRDPVASPLTSEAVARIQKPGAEDDVVTKERIFAAVGIKVNRQNEEDIPADDEKKTVTASLPELPA
jgi:hypothetical protein